MVRLPTNNRRQRRRSPRWLKKAPPVLHVSPRVNPRPWDPGFQPQARTNPCRPWDPGFARGNPCMVRPFIRGRGIN